jgi:hypothetical protein
MDEQLMKHIERFNSKLDTLSEQITKLREDVAGLKVKSSLWGGIMGSVTSTIAALIYAFHGK